MTTYVNILPKFRNLCYLLHFLELKCKMDKLTWLKLWVTHFASGKWFIQSLFVSSSEYNFNLYVFS